MSENGVGIENKGNVTGQTIINIQSMSGNIGVPVTQQVAPIYLAGNGVPTVKPIILNSDFYNLFVLYGEDFNKVQLRIDVSRSITEYTEPEIKERFTPLDSEKIEQITRLPSLFLSECTHSNGTFAPNQIANIGLVTKIRKRGNDYVIDFQKFAQIPFEPIMQVLCNLDIRADYRGYGEMTRTHWAIKEVDLINELRLAGVSVFNAGH